jgi:CheY-like chemotaxis protein
MKRLKILFVEDLSTDVEIAQRVLKQHGLDFSARVIDTEPAYRQALDEFQPDVIISDYAMPTFDGMRALEIALAHPVGFPFVVLTGSMNEETAVACLKAGANDYVIKEKIRRLPFAVLEAIEKFHITDQKERAEAEVRRNLVQLRALHQIETALVSTLQLDEVLEIILEAISRVINCDSFSVQILEGEALKIIACRGFKHPEEVVGLTYPLAPKFPNFRVIEEGRPLAFGDIVREYPHFETEADDYGSHHVRSWLGAPLIAQGITLGMIAFDRATVTPFTEDEIGLADMFSAQAAIAIHNADLYERTRQQLTQLTILRRIDSLITSSLSLEQALPDLLADIQNGLGVNAAAVYLFDEASEALALEGWRGLLKEPKTEKMIPLGFGSKGQVASRRERLYSRSNL